MKFEAYILPTPAIVLIAILLLDLGQTQRFVNAILNLRVGVGKHARAKLKFILIGISAFRLLVQISYLGYTKSRYREFTSNVIAGHMLASVDAEDRLKISVSRAERNFWICFMNIGLWLTVARMNAVLGHLNKKIQNSKLQGPFRPVDMPENTKPVTVRNRKEQKI
ncbi:putative transmembrane protein [Gregarina niphandrodes]|uniref:Transmembrane protein n=1 Tax=Gregarina niphandrodes TaxID=110365 RepID=A0A023BC17_GRENI|nr:putative transmembrane protein [Gregarina niphandrodes]EZG81178.1 putative transmembrane protein [Gregarina niphandrodes]|eukprot:XP_011134236.1 putative transmembrane protein [Gregarina niphandrodes]